jgi:uncharacterized membrane protein YhaH (DUF805 family)
MNWYLKCLDQYSDFSGRARRKEYWMFVLFYYIFAIAATIIDKVLGLVVWEELGSGIFYIVYQLGLFLPGLSVAVRRLHDIDKSGWWLFIALIPIIGLIWLLVLLATDGDEGENQYDDDPKEEEDPEYVLDF